MPNKNKLSIYMIKDEFENDDDIIDGYSNDFLIEGIGTVYIGSSHIATTS